MIFPRSPAVEKGHKVDVIHQFVEIGAHLQLEASAVGGDLDGMLQGLHLPQVLVIDPLLPVLLVLQQQVQEVTILLEGVIPLVVVHCAWQLQEVVGQVGHPPLVLLLGQQMRAVHLRFLRLLRLGLVVVQLLVVLGRHGLAFEKLGELEDVFGVRSAEEMLQDVGDGLELQQWKEHEDVLQVLQGASPFPDVLDLLEHQAADVDPQRAQDVPALNDLQQLVEGVLHLGLAELDGQPIEHPIVHRLPSLLIVGAAALFRPLVGPLDHDDGVDERLAADFSGVDEDGLVLLLHLAQLKLLVCVHELYVLVERLHLPLLLVLTLLDIQELDEQLRAVLDGINDQVFNEGDESFGAEAVLAQNEGDLRQFLEDGPRPDDPIIEQHLLNRRLSDNKIFLKLLLLELLLDIDIEPVSD